MEFGDLSPDSNLEPPSETCRMVNFISSKGPKVSKVSKETCHVIAKLSFRFGSVYFEGFRASR
jgi:hypothetical protein